jgi:hypothetical protein
VIGEKTITECNVIFVLGEHRTTLQEEALTNTIFKSCSRKFEASILNSISSSSDLWCRLAFEIYEIAEIIAALAIT